MMTAMGYAIQLTDRTPAQPGASEELSLLVLYGGKPIGSVTIEWHGDLELMISAAKFFGGKSPGIDNAWQLADMVRRAVEAENPDGITAAAEGFISRDGEELVWEISLDGAARGRSEARKSHG